MSARLACLLVVVAALSACATQPAPPRLAAIAQAQQPADAEPVLSAEVLAPAAPSPAPAAARWEAIGESVQKRPLLAAQSGSGPMRVYLIGGIHGDETEGRTVLEALKDLSDARVTLRVVRDLNPDGTAAGRRDNARGFDLNRNWPARNFNPRSSGGRAPLSEPETRAVEADLRAFDPDLVLVLHSIKIGPFVNFDGPAAPFATAFVDAARRVSPRWTVRPSMGYPTPGSLGSYLGIDRGVPILTAEFRRGQDEASAIAALREGLQGILDSAAARRKQLAQAGSR